MSNFLLKMFNCISMLKYGSEIAHIHVKIKMVALTRHRHQLLKLVVLWSGFGPDFENCGPEK